MAVISAAFIITDLWEQFDILENKLFKFLAYS